MNNLLRSLASTIAVCLGLFGALSSTDAQITFQSNGSTARCGADFGGSPTQDVVPAHPTTQNGFYSSSPLPGSVSALSANGWASMNWSLSDGTQGAITAGGSSHQGYNGFYSNGQYLYGWGRASLDLSFHVAQPFKYSAVSATSHVTGLTGSTGFLPVGDHQISGQSYGSPGGFSINVRLTAASQSEAQVLNNVALELDPPFQAPDSAGNVRWWVRMVFRPNAPDIGTAAAALGGYTINFVSTIIDGPNSWEWIQNGATIKPLGEPMPSSGLMDPIPMASLFQSRSIRDTRVSPNPFPNTFNYPLDSTVAPLYFNNDYVNNLRSASEIVWTDSPTMQAGMFASTDKPITFRTQAVVVDQSGNIKAYLGSPRVWSCDQTTVTGRCYTSMTPDQDGGGPIQNGGITLGLPIPKITIQLNSSPTSQARLSFGTVHPNYGYRLESTDDLSTGNWGELIGAPQSNIGLQRIVTDQNAGGNRRFYRVSVSHP